VSPQAKAFDEQLWPDIFLVIFTIFRFQVPNLSLPNQFWILIQVSRPEFNKDTLGYIQLNTTAYKRGIRNNAQLAIIDYRFMKSRRDYQVLLYGNIFQKLYMSWFA